MNSALVLVFIVVVAYFAAHVAFEWLARRYLVVSGAEYLVLGWLIGPWGAGLLTRGDGTYGALEQFAPLVTLALGWAGVIIGMQFYLPVLVRVAAVTWQVAWVEALVTLGTVAAITSVALEWQFGIGTSASVSAGLALGAIAASSAPAGIEVVARRLGQRGPVLQQLELTAAVDAVAAVIAVGLLACFLHVPPEAGRAPTTTEWAVIGVAVGVVSGALFHLFLGNAHESPDRLVISLAGAIALASGAAAYMHLSPLLVTTVMGVTLANTSPKRRLIADALAAAERPFYFLLLVVAGASWSPGRAAWLLPLALFLLLRLTAKVGAARLSARIARQLHALGPHWGRAMIGQGGLALALALDYASRRAPLHQFVFTAAIASVLLTDVASAWLVHHVVASANETRRSGAGTAVADEAVAAPAEVAPAAAAAEEG